MFQNKIKHISDHCYVYILYKLVSKSSLSVFPFDYLFWRIALQHSWSSLFTQKHIFCNHVSLDKRLMTANIILYAAFIHQPNLWASKPLSESLFSSPVVQLPSHQWQRGEVSTAMFILSTIQQQAVLRVCLYHRETFQCSVHPFERQQKSLGKKIPMVLYLKLQSDLKCLVGVLQGFKGHVRVAIKPGKVHWYNWKKTKDKIMINVFLWLQKVGSAGICDIVFILFFQDGKGMSCPTLPLTQSYSSCLSLPKTFSTPKTQTNKGNN